MSRPLRKVAGDLESPLLSISLIHSQCQSGLMCRKLTDRVVYPSSRVRIPSDYVSQPVGPHEAKTWGAGVPATHRAI